MAKKRSKVPVKKSVRTRKKVSADPVLTDAVATDIATEPIAVASVPTAFVRTGSDSTAIATEPNPVEWSEPAAAAVPIDEVRRRAYSYWVQGNPDPLANWFRAENELRRLY